MIDHTIEMDQEMDSEMLVQMTDTLPDNDRVTDSSSNSRKRHSSPNASTSPVIKRWSVSYSTYSKWSEELMLSWLDCECIRKGTKRVVKKLKCTMCIQYKLRIEFRRNYSDKWQTV